MGDIYTEVKKITRIYSKKKVDQKRKRIHPLLLDL